MKIINLSQGEPAWFAWRQQGVTASEAAIVLNRSRYKTRWRLWAEKTGLIIETDVSANPWVRQGIANEDLARQCFEAARGDMLLPLCVQSQQHPIMQASLDGLNDRGEPVELKCPSPTVWKMVCEQQTASGAYQLYQLQVQAQLLEAAGSFWRQGVSKQAPEKDLERDVFTPQGEQLNAWEQATAGYRQSDEQIVALKQQLKRCEGEQKAHLEQLKALMGDYYHATANGLQLTRYAVAGRVNYAQFIADRLGTVTADELAPFRESSTERYRVTLQGLLKVKFSL